jgi:hypothetical protein
MISRRKKLATTHASNFITTAVAGSTIIIFIFLALAHIAAIDRQTDAIGRQSIEIKAFRELREQELKWEKE